MKLVIATPLYPPDIGGPATYSKILEESLVSRGVEVELVKFGDVRHLPKVIRHIAYFHRVRKALKNADIVLALDPVSVGLPAAIAAWTLNKPLVVKIVGDYAWEQGRQRSGITMSLDEFVHVRKVPLLVRFLRMIQTRVAKFSTTVIVPSEYLKKIVSEWGIAGDDIHVIYNSVSDDGGGKVPQQVSSLQHPIAVTAGRLVPWKHMDGIIKAVALLRKRDVYISLVIVGEGNERLHLEALAKETLEDGYYFSGAIDHSQLLATMRFSDVFVLNSSYEGLSHVLIEALLCAIPTIATRVGGNEEVLFDYSGGMLVSENNERELADAIECMAQKKDKIEPANAAKSIERFSQKTMTDSTIAVLSDLI